jgi:CheY-like chemotaxis protein
MGDHRALKLRAGGGALIEARRIGPGERCGPNRRDVHTLVNPGIDFVVLSAAGERHLASYRRIRELHACLGPGFAPGDSRTFELPQTEVERLRAWLVDPFSADAEWFTAAVVGDDADLERAALALGRLRMQPQREHDARRALGVLRRTPPTLAVIGQQLSGGTAVGLVRALRSAEETRDVPLIVVGGDGEAALAAGADEHLPAPLDFRALVERASSLLELV